LKSCHAFLIVAVVVMCRKDMPQINYLSFCVVISLAKCGIWLRKLINFFHFCDFHWVVGTHQNLFEVCLITIRGQE